MKTMNSKQLTAAILAAGALSGFAPSVLAASDWSCGLTSNTCSGTGTPTISTAAFATTANAGTEFAAASLGVYGTHLGVTAAGESTTSPQHALDNSGAKEAVLLTFNKSVALTELSLGWAAWDSDLTVLRYTGNSAPPVLTGKTIAGLVADGWLSVGNYFDSVAAPVQSNNGGNVNVTRLINGGTNAGASSWWLIAAYNSGYGGDNNGTNTYTGSDYVKLLSVGGVNTKDGKVPEPAGLALVGLALIGMVGARKRVVSKA